MGKALAAENRLSNPCWLRFMEIALEGTGFGKEFAVNGSQESWRSRRSRHRMPPLAGGDGIGHEHGDGHGTDTAGDGGDGAALRRDFGKGHVADELVTLRRFRG